MSAHVAQCKVLEAEHEMIQRSTSTAPPVYHVYQVQGCDGHKVKTRVAMISRVYPLIIR